MLQAFDREGSSARGIVAAADQPRRGKLPPEIGGFPRFGAEASARKHRKSCNLSNIPTRVLFEREIRWASHTKAAPVENVGVDHCGPNAPVSEQFLHRSDVVAVLQKMGCKGVSERMAGRALREARSLHRAVDGSLHG